MIWLKDFDTRYNIWVLARNHVLQMEITTVLKKKVLAIKTTHNEHWYILSFYFKMHIDARRKEHRLSKPENQYRLCPASWTFHEMTNNILLESTHLGGNWFLNGSLVDWWFFGNGSHFHCIVSHTTFPQRISFRMIYTEPFFFKHWVFTKLDN